jgi:hypothetical protein
VRWFTYAENLSGPRVRGGLQIFLKWPGWGYVAADGGVRVKHDPSRVIDTPNLDENTSGPGSNAPIDPHEVANSGVPLGRAW